MPELEIHEAGGSIKTNGNHLSTLESDSTSPLSTMSHSSVSVIKTPKEFDALAEAWSQLFEECDVSVFQSFEWQRTWWKHCGEANPSTSLYIIVFQTGERVIGIAPFFVETVRYLGPFAFRRIALIGREISDYLDILVAKGAERDFAQAIAHTLAQDFASFDAIVLEELPEHSIVHSLVHEAFEHLGLRPTSFINDYCPRTELKGSWESTFATFSSNTRSSIRRKQKRLERDGTVRFELTTREDDIEKDIEDFMELHQHRWMQKGAPGSFYSPHLQAFHREIAHLFFERGWLLLAFLRINGERVVGLYEFQHRNTLLFYLSGFKEVESARIYSPGKLLHALCMKVGVERGLKYYDFLRGVEDYKYQFGATDFCNRTLIAFRPGDQTIRLKWKVHLLRLALRRSIARELALLRLVANHDGVLSLAMVRHISRQSVRWVQSTVAKINNPEISIEVRERQLRRRK